MVGYLLVFLIKNHPEYPSTAPSLKAKERYIGQIKINGMRIS